jgi:hypothetical protein
MDESAAASSSWDSIKMSNPLLCSPRVRNCVPAFVDTDLSSTRLDSGTIAAHDGVPLSVFGIDDLIDDTEARLLEGADRCDVPHIGVSQAASGRR